MLRLPVRGHSPPSEWTMVKTGSGARWPCPRPPPRLRPLGAPRRARHVAGRRSRHDPAWPAPTQSPRAPAIPLAPAPTIATRSALGAAFRPLLPARPPPAPPRPVPARATGRMGPDPARSTTAPPGPLFPHRARFDPARRRGHRPPRPEPLRAPAGRRPARVTPAPRPPAAEEDWSPGGRDQARHVVEHLAAPAEAAPRGQLHGPPAWPSAPPRPPVPRPLPSEVQAQAP